MKRLLYSLLGMAVCAVTSETHPGKVTRLGFQDHFGETASRDYMMHKYGIDAEGIADAIRSGFNE